MRATAVISLTLLTALLTAGVSGCDREKSRWRSAQSADSVDAYERFVQLHPHSDFVKQARTRIKQLNEERDWQRVSKTNTLDAYRGFLTRHPDGKWAQEARIRLDAMLLENQLESAPSEKFEVRRIGPGGAVASAPIQQAPAPSAPQEQLPPPQPVAPGEPASIPAAAANVPADVTTTPTASDEGESKPIDRVADAAPPESNAGTFEPSADTPEPGMQPDTRESEATEAPPQSASINDSFGVQLGAFTNESKAYDEWQRLKTVYRSELGTLQPHISTAQTPSGEVFRLQADVGSEQNARAICASLNEKSQGCVVVLPHH